MERKRYSKAPISEVIIGITWERALLQDKGQFYNIYNAILQDFPNIQYFQPLANEDLIGYRLHQEIDLLKTGSNLCRFFSRDRNWLVQMQFNKIFLNWIRQSEDDVYPGFEIVENKFLKILELVSNDDTYTSVKSLDLNYQNRFPWSNYMKDLSELNQFINYKPAEVSIGGRSANLNNAFSRYLFLESGINGYGSLSINTSTDVNDGKTQLLFIDFTLRGKPEENLNGLKNWLESAHNFQYEQFTNFFKNNLKEKWE